MQYTVLNFNFDLYTKNNLVVQPNRKKVKVPENTLQRTAYEPKTY